MFVNFHVYSLGTLAIKRSISIVMSGFGIGKLVLCWAKAGEQRIVKTRVLINMGFGVFILLLGICFLRGALEGAVEEIGEGEKAGRLAGSPQSLKNRFLKVFSVRSFSFNIKGSEPPAKRPRGERGLRG